ncbi:MAG: ABC transporter ATP-binding protein [Alphaproteobacteria bacterium]|nr:ABC transporter ATP-binding protein [Alphaproteobacteria bacterium]
MVNAQLSPHHAKMGHRASAMPITPDTESAQIAVQYDHVDKSYDGRHLVVRDLCLSVKRGEFLTLLGPSGSGKTTSLMMLAGFENPTRGRIFLNDIPVETVPPEKRNIGFVFQNYALFPHMSVAENIAFPLRYRGIKGAAAAAKVAASLAMVRLDGFEARKPAQLSGGQQQRVALARALVFDPHLVLMDEPLGALDKQLREQMQFEIKQIHARLGITFVYVTHDQSEALTMSDRIAVFYNGKIEQIATPTEIYNQPSTEFVASFMGENNFIAVMIAEKLAQPDTSTPPSLSRYFYRVAAQDGTVLTGWSLKSLAEGSSARLAIRPERLEFVENNGRVGQGQSAQWNKILPENRFTALTEKRFFQGDHIRWQMKGLGGHGVIVKSPPTVTFMPEMGAAVTVRCAIESSQLFADDAAVATPANGHAP